MLESTGNSFSQVHRAHELHNEVLEE